MALFLFICCFCFVCAFSFQGHTKIAVPFYNQCHWLDITVKPVLNGHHIKRIPSIKRTVAKFPNLFPLFTLNETFIKWTPLLSGRGHLKSTWNGHFYCCQPVLNGHLNSTTQHARHRKCERLPPTNFNIFTLKNVLWQTYLISFTVQCCFLFRFVV